MPLPAHGPQFLESSQELARLPRLLGAHARGATHPQTSLGHGTPASLLPGHATLQTLQAKNETSWYFIVRVIAAYFGHQVLLQNRYIMWGTGK